MAQDDSADASDVEVVQEIGIDAVLQELQSAVDQVQTLLAESRAEYETAIAERDETVETLEAGLAEHAEQLAAAEARISELDAALVDAQSRAEAAEQSAARSRKTNRPRLTSLKRCKAKCWRNKQRSRNSTRSSHR